MHYKLNNIFFSRGVDSLLPVIALTRTDKLLKQGKPSLSEMIMLDQLWHCDSPSREELQAKHRYN